MQRNWKEVFRSQTEWKQSKNKAKIGVCEISQPLRNQHFVSKPVCSLKPLSAKIFAAVKPLFGTRVPFRSTVTLISQLRNSCEPPKHERSHFCRQSSISQGVLQLRNSCEAPKRENSQFRSQSSISQGISRLRNHFLAHECHFAALYTHFRAAKSLLSSEMAAKWPPSLEIAFKLRNRLTKWRKVCKNTLQNQGKLLKCQQSPTTMHMKRRTPRTLGSHTLSLSFHFWLPKTIKAHSSSWGDYAT